MNFLFGVHCHQPVGNFGFVFEKAYEKSYRPFFELLAKYPKVKMVAHFSGCLLDWIFDHHPEFIDLLKSLADRGQVEMLGGGYYEPILSILPERDQRAQLSLMNKVLRKNFGQAPEGLWLAERVWEPTLPAVLADAGIKAVFLDDSHLLAAGKMPPEVHGYFTTRHLDREVGVFPICEKLRYLIPFAPVEEVFDWLHAEAERRPGTLLTMVDDGEKFGIWPQTWDWVYGKGWLERFFEHLSVAEQVRTMTLTQALAEGENRGPVYLPTLSYREMGEWVLPLEAARVYHGLEEDLKGRPDFSDIKPFIRGGFWRGFFAKYRESERMYQRMILASSRVDEKEKGYVNLLKSQCNCAYWHGVFGGLYLPFLRREVFAQIIRAEAQLKDQPWRETSIGWEARNRTWQAFFSSVGGGMLEELDLRPASLDLLCTIRRRIEFYHGKAGSAGGDHASIHDMGHEMPEDFVPDIQNDPAPRKALLVHQYPHIPESLNEADALDQWKWFDDTARVTSKGGLLKSVCRREGWTITKSVRLDDNSVRAEVAWNQVPTSVWSVEFSLSPADGYWKAGREETPRPLDQPARFDALDRILLFDTASQAVIEIGWEEDVPVRVFPLRTISLSEKGYERIQQGLAILPFFTGKSARFHISLREDLNV